MHDSNDLLHPKLYPLLLLRESLLPGAAAKSKAQIDIHCAEQTDVGIQLFLLGRRGGEQGAGGIHDESAR